MIMIIGGSSSGKAAYLQERFALTPRSGEEISREELFSCPAVCNLERFIYRELAGGREVDTLAEELIKRNPALIFTVQEVGCGVVPLDVGERKYREAVGRVSTKLATFSSEVVRLYYGVPQVIKK
ncbi:MAG: bifunctional adenosylcobinamide kinase/adenosylcobinamide-phosphate guanylyltransferase [Blautia sp.]|nr:bifunctional adenosylcobinamide kinase/adenosylcobinamide-phosphate guanylyltransferase [Blautia sp.]